MVNICDLLFGKHEGVNVIRKNNFFQVYINRNLIGSKIVDEYKARLSQHLTEVSSSQSATVAFVGNYNPKRETITQEGFKPITFSRR